MTPPIRPGPAAAAMPSSARTPVRVAHRRRDHAVEHLDMGARRDLRHHAAKRRVLRDLRQHDVGHDDRRARHRAARRRPPRFHRRSSRCRASIVTNAVSRGSLRRASHASDHRMSGRRAPRAGVTCTRSAEAICIYATGLNDSTSVSQFPTKVALRGRMTQSVHRTVSAHRHPRQPARAVAGTRGAGTARGCPWRPPEAIAIMRDPDQSAT